MSETFRILVINPGSTSTKLGLFENEDLVAEKKLNHSAEDIARFPTSWTRTASEERPWMTFSKK